ncbi:MAG: hypothetical protein K6G83_02025 [Lachnospiraceae bacterium]|nr:hypothetical protein [Lachnospiraceae bacterium]
MAKNHKLLAQLNTLAELKKAERVKEAADDLTPILYAAVALALKEVCGFGYERINRVFLRSQEIWTDFAGKPEDMINLCEEVTGIKMALDGRGG